MARGARAEAEARPSASPWNAAVRVAGAAGLALAGGALLVALVTGRGGGGDPVEGRGAVHAGVCAAEAEARRGDLDGAERAFHGVHQGLHELADAAQQRDRAAAARLLEAKAAVEAGPADAGALARLAEATRTATVAVGEADPGPCR